MSELRGDPSAMLPKDMFAVGGTSGAITGGKDIGDGKDLGTLINLFRMNTDQEIHKMLSGDVSKEVLSGLRAAFTKSGLL